MPLSAHTGPPRWRPRSTRAPPPRGPGGRGGGAIDQRSWRAAKRGDWRGTRGSRSKVERCALCPGDASTPCARLPHAPRSPAPGGELLPPTVRPATADHLDLRGPHGLDRAPPRSTLSGVATLSTSVQGPAPPAPARGDGPAPRQAARSAGAPTGSPPGGQGEAAAARGPAGARRAPPRARGPPSGRRRRPRATRVAGDGRWWSARKRGDDGADGPGAAPRAAGAGGGQGVAAVTAPGLPRGGAARPRARGSRDTIAAAAPRSGANGRAPRGDRPRARRRSRARPRGRAAGAS